MSAVAERYADALFEVAQETHVLQAVADGVQLLHRLITTLPTFHAFLRNPEILLEEKTTVLQQVLGTHLAPLVQQFLRLLIRQQRVTDWDDIQQAFVTRYRRSQGLEHAVVRSARPLPPPLLTHITTQLARWRQTTITLAQEVDPRLIGGIQVRIGSLLVDGSLRAQLDAIAQALIAVPVH